MLCLAGLALFGLALAACEIGEPRFARAPLAEVTNASRLTACAEEDNVYVRLGGAGIRRFSITARHPAYLADLARDSMAPDFTACDMSGDPAFPGTPRTVILHRDADWQLVGLAFASFWRPADVPVRVGTVREDGLHLLQLFRTLDGRRIEVLVLYPADGYWRAKPLPPPHLADSGYGSSFLVGPVEEVGRPLVALSEVEFRPDRAAFLLRFRRGGTGSLRVVQADRTQTQLEVGLDAGAPVFAALRSMFVASDNNDAAEIAWRRGDGSAGGPRPIMAPLTESVTHVQFGRRTVSRHNSSAPDMEFGDFAR